MVGAISMLSSILMFASPLFSILSIWRKRDSTAISFSLGSITLVVSAVWTVYGVGKGDANIIIPNLLGTALGALLLALRLAIPKTAAPFSGGKERSSFDPLIQEEDVIAVCSNPLKRIVY